MKFQNPWVMEFRTECTDTGSAVGIATGYGLDGRGVGVRVAREPSPYLIGYMGSFAGSKVAGAWSCRGA
jgi:hypothetical protein